MRKLLLALGIICTSMPLTQVAQSFEQPRGQGHHVQAQQFHPQHSHPLTGCVSIGNKTPTPFN